MARQPRTREPKKKFTEQKRVVCRICGAEKFIYSTKTGPTWQCPSNINH